MITARIAFKAGFFVRATLRNDERGAAAERRTMSAAYRIASELALTPFKGAINVDAHDGIVTMEFAHRATGEAQNAAIDMLRGALSEIGTIAYNQTARVDETIFRG